MQQQHLGDPPDGRLERILLLDEADSPAARALAIAENPAAADEAVVGAVVWDCGLVLAHYLIKLAATGVCLKRAQHSGS